MSVSKGLTNYINIIPFNGCVCQIVKLCEYKQTFLKPTIYTIKEQNLSLNRFF